MKRFLKITAICKKKIFHYDDNLNLTCLSMGWSTTPTIYFVKKKGYTDFFVQAASEIFIQHKR